MTKLGLTSCGRLSGSFRGTETESRTPGGSTWREEFLGAHRCEDAVGDNSNELWEEDVWGGEGCGENKDFAMQRSCEEIHDVRGMKVHVGWSDEAKCRKSSMYIPHSGNDSVEDRQYRGRAGVSRSVPLGATDWGNALHDDGAVEDEGEDEKDEDEEGSAGLVPPHELIAREFAKSQAMAFSVSEGAGRTLKGTDLRRLRSAVWRQTGFME